MGSEDYRWAIVKDTIGPALFFVLNVFFIALAQCLLLCSVTTPTYILLLTGRLASNSSDTEGWTPFDLIPYISILGFIAISFVADQQQWDFHQAKADYKETAKVPADYDRADLDRGFLTTGLWHYSRHPNFTAEQSVWVTLYVWSCIATGTLYNWTGVGAVSYLILFQASTWLTELLSARKYPDYQIYRRTVGKFLPIPGQTARFPVTSPEASNGTVSANGNAKKA